MNKTRIFQKIAPPANGRRFVVADIHGCAKTFEKLVTEKMQLTHQDQLFLLGDYIDKGPHSKAVIDFILALQAKGYSVYPLRGNHEDELLNAYSSYKPMMFKYYMITNRTRNFADDEGQILPHYLSFFENLPYYFELDDFYLVHAGFNFSQENPLLDLTSMLWIRTFEVNRGVTGNRRIVHGHTPIVYSTLKKQDFKKALCINLDNGCFYTAKNNDPLVAEHYGRLCALNLDTMELLEQENEDLILSYLRKETV